jgi:purine-nucleoside phosphorylase
MSTPHNQATMQQIAKTVLMPGDPLRAKYIADHFLSDVICFNTVRNMLGYTGTYQGKRISVMGSGMGMPSIGIYSYELFKTYQVDNIIRIGSAGAYSPALKLFDVMLVKESYSESSFAKSQNGSGKHLVKSNSALNRQVVKAAKKLAIPLIIGRVHSSDVFYREGGNQCEWYLDTKKCLAVEMESFALFHNAIVLGKQATCLLTISDSLVTHEETTTEQREKAFTNMMKIALELA